MIFQVSASDMGAENWVKVSVKHLRGRGQAVAFDAQGNYPLWRMTWLKNGPIDKVGVTTYEWTMHQVCHKRPEPP